MTELAIYIATIESYGTKCMYFHVSSWKEGTKEKNICSNHNATNKNIDSCTSKKVCFKIYQVTLVQGLSTFLSMRSN